MRNTKKRKVDRRSLGGDGTKNPGECSEEGNIKLDARHLDAFRRAIVTRTSSNRGKFSEFEGRISTRWGVIRTCHGSRYDADEGRLEGRILDRMYAYQFAPRGGWKPLGPGLRSIEKESQPSLERDLQKVPATKLKSLFEEYCGSARRKYKHGKKALVHELAEMFFTGSAPTTRREEEREVLKESRLTRSTCFSFSIIDADGKKAVRIIPRDVMHEIMLYLKHDKGFLFSVGLVSWNWFHLVLSTWTDLTVNSASVEMIPELVLKSARKVKLWDSWTGRLSELETVMEKISPQIHHIVLRTEDLCGFISFIRTWKKVVRAGKKRQASVFPCLGRVTFFVTSSRRDVKKLPKYQIGKVTRFLHNISRFAISDIVPNLDVLAFPPLIHLATGLPLRRLAIRLNRLYSEFPGEDWPYFPSLNSLTVEIPLVTQATTIDPSFFSWFAKQVSTIQDLFVLATLDSRWVMSGSKGLLDKFFELPIEPSNLALLKTVSLKGSPILPSCTSMVSFLCACPAIVELRLHSEGGISAALQIGVEVMKSRPTLEILSVRGIISWSRDRDEKLTPAMRHLVETVDIHPSIKFVRVQAPEPVSATFLCNDGDSKLVVRDDRSSTYRRCDLLTSLAELPQRLPRSLAQQSLLFAEARLPDLLKKNFRAVKVTTDWRKQLKYHPFSGRVSGEMFKGGILSNKTVDFSAHWIQTGFAKKCPRLRPSSAERGVLSKKERQSRIYWGHEYY